MQARNLRVPQPFGKGRCNVIRGCFERRGRTDWAVLCSNSGASQILVFWGGAVAAIDSLAARPDEVYMQGIDLGRVGYSRWITPIGPTAIRKLGRELGDGTQPKATLDHDGIEDVYIEKASEIHFHHDRVWLLLPGMD